MLLVTADEMRALDRAAIAGLGVPAAVLMESAGRGVADVVGALVDLSRTRVVVYAGHGNNGGDGLVAARHLAGRGARVQVILCAPAAKLKGEAQLHFDACQRSGVPILDGADAESLARAAGETADADLVIDALLGTGIDREVAGHLVDAIGLINTQRGLKVAVDLPSGLSADRGVPLGVCVRADHTVTFAFAKRGLVVAPGFVYAGRLHVVDIGIPERLAIQHGVRAQLLDDRCLEPVRAPYHPLAHKGTRGHLLVVAGSTGKSGAALLCGRAALRAGAGLVTVCAPEGVRQILDGRVPELMTAGYPFPGDPLDAWRAIEPLLDGKRAIAIGPGVPADAHFRPLVGRLIAAARERGLGVVLDADGLNHLAAAPELLGSAPERTVLTPHPGEAARLAGAKLSIGELQADRIAWAEKLATRFGVVVALKGARTVCAAPDGRIAVCPTGNPGLGTGGTGDVLAGVVGALLAEGEGAWQAATAGVYWHGAAGDRIARRTGMRGLTASDVIDELLATLHDR